MSNNVNIFDDVKKIIIETSSSIGVKDKSLLDKISIEPPREKLHGDISTNISMIVSKSLKKSPIHIAKIVKSKLLKFDFIKEVDIAGPGFINLKLDTSVWYNCCKHILSYGDKFGRCNLGKNKTINIEFVSANPTGPIHIGHARGAVFGDSLANLMEFSGYNVTREFYINDAGEQVNNLAKSVYIRYLEILNKKTSAFGENLYPGEYLIPVAKAIINAHGNKYIDAKESEWLPLFRKISIESMLSLIKKDLLLIDVKHDIFTSELDIHNEGKIEKVINFLNKKSLLYEGVLEPPKGKLKEDWVSRPQLLFKSTRFGDDIDRVMKKADDSWTYFAADAAYHYDKYLRNYSKVVNIWGADHGGYIKRLEGVLSAISDNKIDFDVKLCQLVNLSKDGKPIKMSKRADNFITMKSVIDAVGSDILRFIMLTRRNDASIDFDLAKVKEESKENPVYYVQYAYARINSLFENAKSLKINIGKDVDLTVLVQKEEINILKLLASWPRFVEAAAKAQEPHRITIFLNDLASAFHSLWAKGNEEQNLRYIIEDDLVLTSARLSMIKAIQIVIGVGFKLIGIKPKEKLK